MQNKFILLLICVTTLLMAGCGANDKNFLGSGAAQVPMYNIEAPADGKILGLISEKGERITKGQPLFAIADEATDDMAAKLTANLAKAQAELKSMEEGTATPAPSGSVNAMQAQLAAAQQKADKMNRLLAMGAVSRRQADAANAELAAAQANLAAAQTNSILLRPASPEAIASQKELITQLQKELTQAKTRQQANEAISPCTGVIVEKLANIGSTAKKSQKILSLKALDTCTVTFKVSPAKAKELHTGQAVLLTASGYKAPFNGQISEIKDDAITVTSTEKPEDMQAGVSVDVALAQ